MQLCGRAQAVVPPFFLPARVLLPASGAVPPPPPSSPGALCLLSSAAGVSADACMEECVPGQHFQTESCTFFLHKSYKKRRHRHCDKCLIRSVKWFSFHPAPGLSSGSSLRPFTLKRAHSVNGLFIASKMVLIYSGTMFCVQCHAPYYLGHK